jgi:RNA polymerase sigma-70 factor, ECF subfamily
VTECVASLQSPSVNAEVEGDAALSSCAERFRTVYQCEAPYVWRTLRRLGVRGRDLEDLTHDTFMAAYRRFDEFDTTRAVRPWLFGFAFRIAADYRKRASHRYEDVADELSDMVDERPLPDEAFATRQARSLVARALDAMDLERRAVLVMHDLDGHSVPEIAGALSIPLNTAYSRLRLAREQFARAAEQVSSARGGS